MGGLSIKACIRDKVGTGAARAVRRDGMVPGVIYGHEEGMHISISAKDASIICNRFDAKTNVVKLDFNGKECKVLAKQVSLHPVTDSIEHVEFISVDGDAQVKIDIPIKIVGREQSIEIKRGGVINMAKRFLKCTVRNNSIPEFITIDISSVKMGTPVSLRDIAIPSGVVSVHEDLDQTVLKITGKRSIALDVEVEKKEAGAAAEKKDESAAKPAATKPASK
jgi:large subunit ribosomal protein L25